MASSLSLPKNLVFAILDDSAMVRVNLRLALQRDFEASKESIILGETEDEALYFVEKCIQLKPDICILDENLDYTSSGGNLLLGSTLAEDLRVQGYRGVILIHSANELLRGNLNVSVIDGFIIKGTHRSAVKSQIAEIFRKKSKSRR